MKVKVLALPFLEIAQPLIGELHVHGIHDGDLLVQNDIGIVSHAERDNILTFEEINLMIIDTDILDRICDLHNWKFSISYNSI